MATLSDVVGDSYSNIPQYSGASYAEDMYRQQQETMADYMTRLAAQRAAGVLGGGGMLDTEAPLGEVVQNCPAGYTWDANANACVKVSGKTTDSYQDIKDRMYGGRTKDEVYRDIVQLRNAPYDWQEWAIGPVGDRTWFGDLIGVDEVGNFEKTYLESLSPEKREEAEQYARVMMGPQQPTMDEINYKLDQFNDAIGQYTPTGMLTNAIDYLTGGLSSVDQGIRDFFGVKTPQPTPSQQVDAITNRAGMFSPAVAKPVAPFAMPTVMGNLSPVEAALSRSLASGADSDAGMMAEFERAIAEDEVNKARSGRRSSSTAREVQNRIARNRGLAIARNDSRADGSFGD